MSENSAPLPSDHPALVAWNAYRTTPEYENTWQWAAQNQHRDGSLWAAFYEGWQVAEAAHQRLKEGQ